MMPRRPLLPGQRRSDVGRMQESKARAMHEDGMRQPEAEIMLKDNSFNGARGWGDGLLFTSGKAHQIRPKDNIGVTSGHIEDGSIYLSLEDPTDRPEDALNSLQLRTDHTLCVACNDLLNYYCRYSDESSKRRIDPDSAIASSMNNNVVHHSSLFSLYAFAEVTKQKCRICTDVWSKVKSTYPNFDAALFSDYVIECCWTKRSDSQSERKMWFVMVNPAVDKDPQWNWQPTLQVSLWPKSRFAHHFRSEGIAKSIIPIRGPWDTCDEAGGTNDGLRTRGLALGWLDRCRRDADGQHALCSKQDDNFLPTRLLDVRKALQTGKVCLVPATEQSYRFDNDNEYVTLSHCWGAWGAKENPVLLAANLSSRQHEGLALDLLPQTFKDALRITSWIGLNWLWIDSLCIIQDSPSDWKTEAAMMDRVYQNSQVNISADWGEDSRAGCFSHRAESDITPLEFSSTRGEDSWVMTTENVFGWMRSATSLTRAWIHRERQLSRRILHFTEKELVWECCGLGKAGFASETLPGGAPFTRLFEGSTKFQIEWSEADDSSNERSAQDRLTKIHKLWDTTCEGLSNKSVTYATDMPVILSSLAREMHGMMPRDEYVCGVWRSTLPESLAWWTESVKPDGIGYIAPSWSWLSVANPVKLALHNRHQNKLPVAEVLDINVELDSNDIYGAVTKGELRMVGYIRRLHFHFIDTGRFIISVIEKDANGDDRLRLIGPDWTENDGHQCQLTHDATLYLDHQEHECYAFFTTIAEWAQDISTCHRKITCLLLDAVEGGKGTYRRIGTLDQLSDEYSFRMRYTVAPGSNDVEAGVTRNLHVENRIGYQGPPSSAKQNINPMANSPSLVSIWGLLAEFVRRNRWTVISRSKKEESATVSTPDDAEPAADPNALAQDAEMNDEHWAPYRSLISQIRRHPSSGIQTLANEHEEGQMIEFAAKILPGTRAYGSNLTPLETLYQFDDVLDELRREQGVVSWVKRLDMVEITLI